jgi:hypothetical protein
MCYNAETSLATFVFAAVVCVILWYRNYPDDRMMAIIWLSIMAMQLAEYAMWKDQRCGNINRYATIIAMLILFLQPVFMVWAVKWYGKSVLPPSYVDIIAYGTLAIMALNSIMLLANIPAGKICSTPGAMGHLVWDHTKLMNRLPTVLTWLWAILYWVVPPLLLLTTRPFSLGVVYLAVLMASLLFAYMITNGKDKQWKSLWCWISNPLSLVPLIAGYIYVNYK